MKNYLKKNVNLLFYITPFFFLLPVNYLTMCAFLFILISIFVLRENKFKIKFDTLDKILCLFFIFTILSGIKFKFESSLELFDFEIIKSIGLLRFFLVYILTKNLINYNLINLKKFSFICLLLCLFISINIIATHIFGHDFLGNRKLESINRYSSIFGERAVAGSYIFSFFFIALLYLYFFKNNFLFKTFFLIIISYGIMLTFDRSPYILFILSIILLSFLNLKNNIKFFYMTMIVIFLNIIVFFNYDQAYKRHISSINLIERFTKFFKIEDHSKIQILQKGGNYTYYEIYNEALSIINHDYTFLGSGFKTYYRRCTGFREQTNIESITSGYANACPSHSHNLYLEIGISSGLIGLTIFIFFILLNIKIFLAKIFDRYNKSSRNFVIFTILLISFLADVVPRPHGNLFGSYNGFLFFFKIAFLYAFLIKVHRMQRFK